MLAIALAVLLAHLPFLLGLLDPNPLARSSQLLASSRAALLPGVPVLDPDDGIISQALGHRAALDLTHLTLPWWNSYSGAGTPLAGEVQSAALFVPTLLTLFSNGQLYEHMALELLAGASTFLLLRRLGLGRMASMTGGIVFALNGTFAWFGHAMVNPVAFLPMLLLGIERAYGAAGAGRRGGWRLIAIAGALSVYSGFPEVAYVNAVLAAMWFVWRGCVVAPGRRRALAIKVGAGTLIGGLLSAPLLIAMLDFFAYATIPLHSTGFYGSIHLGASGAGQLLLPYVYGPLFAYPNVNWGLVGGYVSAALVSLSVLGVLAGRHRGLVIVLLVWLALALGRVYGVPGLGVVLGLLPGMDAVEFTRYAFPAIELAAIVLAALGLDSLARGDVARRGLAGATALALALVGLSALGAHSGASAPGSAHALTAYYGLSILWAALGVVAVAVGARPRRGRPPSRSAVALVAVVLIADALVLFGLPELSTPRHQHLDTRPLAYLRRHLGHARYVTEAGLQANYGAYFGLASLNINDGAIATSFANHVERRLDPFVAPTLFVGRAGAAALLFALPPPRQVLAHLAAYRAAGVAYVLARPEMPLPAIDGLRLVQATPTTLIYHLAGAAPYFSAPGCQVGAATLTDVRLSCAHASTLTRLETYLPGWTASSNDGPLAVAASGVFQRVSVPAGDTRLRFAFTPPYLLWGWFAFGSGVTALVLAALRRRRQ